MLWPRPGSVAGHDPAGDDEVTDLTRHCGDTHEIDAAKAIEAEHATFTYARVAEPKPTLGDLEQLLAR